METEVGLGDVVAVSRGHDDHAGRIGLVAEVRRRFDDGADVVLSLAGEEPVEMDASDVDPDWRGAMLPEARDMREALVRAVTLVGLLTIRDVLSAGDAAIDAAGLNPWCVNEGRATGDESLSPFWLHDAVERADRMVTCLTEAASTEELASDLEAVAEAASRAAWLVAIPTVGQTFDAGDAHIEAAGLDVWCMRDGRATREDRLGSTASWRLRHAAERAAALRTDLAPCLADAAHEAPHP